MIKVTVNGEQIELPKDVTISEMITQLGYTDKWFGVAINTHFVPKDKHATRVLKEGDEIEILAPVVGG